MGGSVVGVAYQLEKKLGDPSKGSTLLWKAAFIPTGFVAAYAVMEQEWLTVILAVALLVLFALITTYSRSAAAGSRGAGSSEIEKKMEQCC